jgi:hypothetical protein
VTASSRVTEEDNQSGIRNPESGYPESRIVIAVQVGNILLYVIIIPSFGTKSSGLKQKRTRTCRS